MALKKKMLKCNARLIVSTRKARELSQVELSVKAGVSMSTLQRLEQCRRGSLDVLTKLAGALEMPVADLVADAPVPA